MSGALSIRPAVPADAAALAIFAERTFRDAFADGNAPENLGAYCARAYGANVQSREIADPLLRTLLCESARTLVGYGQLRLETPIDCVPARRPARLQRIYVDAAWHGRGVAPLLMSALLDAAAGADRVWLGVWERNPRALAFYRKFGFETVGSMDFHFGDEVQTDLVMARAAR